MIKWDALIRPKDFGGLGILDVRAMNICLVAKWLDRLENDPNNVCCELLRRKYLGSKNIFQESIWAQRISFKLKRFLARSFGEVC